MVGVASEVKVVPESVLISSWYPVAPLEAGQVKSISVVEIAVAVSVGATGSGGGRAVSGAEVPPALVAETR